MLRKNKNRKNNKGHWFLKIKDFHRKFRDFFQNCYKPKNAKKK